MFDLSRASCKVMYGYVRHGYVGHGYVGRAIDTDWTYLVSHKQHSV